MDGQLLCDELLFHPWQRLSGHCMPMSQPWRRQCTPGLCFSSEATIWSYNLTPSVVLSVSCTYGSVHRLPMLFLSVYVQLYIHAHGHGSSNSRPCYCTALPASDAALSLRQKEKMPYLGTRRRIMAEAVKSDGQYADGRCSGVSPLTRSTPPRE